MSPRASSLSIGTPLSGGRWQRLKARSSLEFGGPAQRGRQLERYATAYPYAKSHNENFNSAMEVSEVSKTVYLSQRGDDKNGGLNSAAPVLTPERAIKIAIREGATTIHIIGGDPYRRRTNAELEMSGRGHCRYRIDFA